MITMLSEFLQFMEDNNYHYFDMRGQWYDAYGDAPIDKNVIIMEFLKQKVNGNTKA